MRGAGYDTFSLGCHIVAPAQPAVTVFAAKKVKEDNERV